MLLSYPCMSYSLIVPPNATANLLCYHSRIYRSALLSLVFAYVCWNSYSQMGCRLLQSYIKWKQSNSFMKDLGFVGKRLKLSFILFGDLRTVKSLMSYASRLRFPLWSCKLSRLLPRLPLWLSSFLFLFDSIPHISVFLFFTILQSLHLSVVLNFWFLSIIIGKAKNMLFLSSV